MSDFAYPLHEECGVFGIYDRAGTEDVAAAAYSALYALQHRGQESCGIAVNDDGVINGHRDLGLVNEVFTPAVLASLANPNAHMATGHVRYATAGSRVRANAQPMIVRHGRGTMALCHNGNLTNAIELRRQLENEGAIFHGSSDTEVICYLITRNRLRMGSIETARWNGQRCDEEATAAGEAQRRAEAAEAEAIQLKAKLYDLLVAGK